MGLVITLVLAVTGWFAGLRMRDPATRQVVSGVLSALVSVGLLAALTFWRAAHLVGAPPDPAYLPAGRQAGQAGGGPSFSWFAAPLDEVTAVLCALLSAAWLLVPLLGFLLGSLVRFQGGRR